MERKVLFKDFVSSGSQLRRNVVPTAVISDNGDHAVGEFWDANKTIDVIVNNSHEAHDNIRELDEYTHSQVNRLDKDKVSRIGQEGVTAITNIQALTDSQINNLKTGDVVVKTTGDEKHAYTVAYKKDNEMSLVYVDRWTVEEVYYEKQNGSWTHVLTDILPFKFKTIFGQSIIGEGDVEAYIQTSVKAYEPMPSSWTDNSNTMAQLISAINADSDAQKGKIYIGTVSLSDLPSGVSQGEMKVEVMGSQGGKKILVFTLSSTDISPYKWEYTSYNMGDGPWRSWMLNNTTIDYNDLTNKPDIASLTSRIEALEIAAGISNSEEQ